MKEAILVSACLFSIPCRYDGNRASNCLSEEIQSFLKQNFVLVPVCPEQSGGLSTPRKCMEIQGGDGFGVLEKKAFVKSQDGENFTSRLILGAEIVYNIALITKATMMLGQRKSPSCSCSQIYEGSFQGKLIQGYGVTTAFLSNHGIKVLDTENMDTLFYGKEWQCPGN
ncbi:MAG: DUF523 domain-containing protein [Candidatus Brocadiae bacterium]|nr:DUF523 domain-containing protein [Candidatus Brocadiia bacterium]